MKKKLLQKLSLLLVSIGLSTAAVAQDTWYPVVTVGLGNANNSISRCLTSFNGQIYVAMNGTEGTIYHTGSGNSNSWNLTYSNPNVASVDVISTSPAGGGQMYIATVGITPGTSEVFRSTDGASWFDYFITSSSITHIVPFKGLGTVDSIYLVDANANGALILRSYFNSNDPTATSDWDTVFDFSTVSLGLQVASMAVHNGKLFVGTTNATLWSTADGVNWNQNINVGTGFGNANNQNIRSIVSFGPNIYVATTNGAEGAQIWRSADETTWTKQYQANSAYQQIPCLAVADNKLWATLQANTIAGSVIKSADGSNFVISDDYGFGQIENSGSLSSIVQFGNNVYWCGEYYFGGLIAPNPGSGNARAALEPGAQVWRTCVVAPDVISAGPDQLVCQGTSTTLTVSGSFGPYEWSNGQTTQSINISSPGTYKVDAVGPNGCTSSDVVVRTDKPSPTITPPNMPPPMCNGNSIPLFASAVSNVYIPDPPIHKTTNDTIDDSLGGEVYDTISVSGIPTACACDAIMSITIDSLYHTYSEDLTIGIYTPTGSYATLASAIGVGSDNSYFGTEFIMNASDYIGSTPPPYTGSFIPTDPLNSLLGDPNGNWILRVQDHTGGDNGSLKGWTIRFKVDDTVMTYSWTPATGLSSTTTLNTIASPTTSTNYTITATNTTGCSSEQYVPVSIVEILMPDADTLCFGSSLNLFANGASPAAVWTPATNLSVTTGAGTTTYTTSDITYYITDTISGCPLYDSIFVYANPDLILTSPATQNICYADTAVLAATATGGTAPYTYSWDIGGTYFYGQTIYQPLTTPTSYTINAVDLAGCVAGGFTNVTVSPSTDIYGNVSYSGGPVASSDIVIYKYENFLTHFDTVQITTTDALGNYHFTAVNHAKYLIEVFPNATYTTLVPTYNGDVFLWDAAPFFMHDCAMDDTVNIVAVEEATLGGPGSLSGTIIEGPGFMRAPGDPVPGIDVKLGRNPGGHMMTNTQTNGSGQYSFTGVPLNIPGEWYTVYVDIPGIGRDSSYSVTLDASNVSVDSLNYYVDSTVVYILDPVVTTGVGNNKVSANTFNVYPNPSKGNSTIEYTIAEDSKVALGIYNVLGVKVIDIANTEQTEGTYKYSINTKEYQLKSGVYFITLITNGKTSIHRLVVTE